MSYKPDTYLLEGLIESLSSINDPRDAGTLHPLIDILVISVLAVMPGAETIADIETFAKERLMRYLPLVLLVLARWNP